MFLLQGENILKNIASMYLIGYVLVLRGIVVKCTAAIFFFYSGLQ